MGAGEAMKGRGPAPAQVLQRTSTVMESLGSAFHRDHTALGGPRPENSARQALDRPSLVQGASIWDALKPRMTATPSPRYCLPRSRRLERFPAPLGRRATVHRSPAA